MAMPRQAEAAGQRLYSGRYAAEMRVVDCWRHIQSGGEDETTHKDNPPCTDSAKSNTFKTVRPKRFILMIDDAVDFWVAMSVGKSEKNKVGVECGHSPALRGTLPKFCSERGMRELGSDNVFRQGRIADFSVPQLNGPL